MIDQDQINRLRRRVSADIALWEGLLDDPERQWVDAHIQLIIAQLQFTLAGLEDGDRTVEPAVGG